MKLGLLAGVRGMVARRFGLRSTCLPRASPIPVRYADEAGRSTQDWPANPNGSPRAAAGLCDATGRLFGLMPHPDAYLHPFHHPLWTRQQAHGTLPAEGAGLAVFRSGVDSAAAAW